MLVFYGVIYSVLSMHQGVLRMNRYNNSTTLLSVHFLYSCGSRFFLRECSSQRKIPRPKNNHQRFHTMTESRWCKVIIVNNNHYFWHFSMHFKSIFSIEILLNLLLILCIFIHAWTYQLVHTVCLLHFVTNPRLLDAMTCASTLPCMCKEKNTLTLVPKISRVIMRSHCALLSCDQINWIYFEAPLY